MEEGSCQQELTSQENQAGNVGQLLQVLGTFSSPIATGTTMKGQMAKIPPHGSVDVIQVL